uniref:Ankyrin repeat protein n=1 Tax=Pithovirus LCPAC403 TaxID=2506596 RepID=A0A481ZDR9_9VIRU|nr:MAG: ankyrin repeat protein [Pithovirus LCPAC403]
MSSVVESLISLGIEIIKTNKDVDIHSKKLFELQTTSKLLSEKWNELTDQLTEDERIQLSQKDIKELENKLIQMKSAYSKSCMETKVKQGDLEEVRFLGEEGVRSDTYIDISAEEGHFGIVKYILSRHGSKENWETCAIHAAKGGHLNIVKYCSDNIVKGESMFRVGMMRAGMNAAEYGHLDILKFIMLRDVDRDGYLKSAKKGGHQDVIDYCEEQVNMNPFRHMLDYVDRDARDHM